jgi:hypothetical protein
MIIHGAINYDQTGRRKKTTTTRTRHRRHTPNGTSSIPDYSYRRTRADDVKSLDTRICDTGVSPDTKIKQEVSKNYTVAVAYNKGAYQVIPKDGIKHIGK